MQLHELFDYKNQLMKDLLTNERIVELLDTDVDIEHAQSLAYSRVFPFEYLPDTVQDGTVFICFDVDVIQALNSTFYEPYLSIWIFAHRSKLRLPEGGVRTDRICEEIAETINGSMQYGLGKLELMAMKRFAPMTDYLGKVVTFKAKDFNTPYKGDKYIPANRKRN